MDNNEFDKLIKRRISEEKSLIEGSNIDDVIDKAFKKVKSKNKIMYSKFLAAAVMLFIITSITINIIKQNEMKISTSNGTEEKSIKDELAIVDVNKEKDKLREEGYIVNKDDIKVDKEVNGATIPTGGNSTDLTTTDRGTSDSPIDNNDVSYDSKCYSGFASLKDKVFSADCVLKGEVLGVRYYIENKQAYTKAKILVKESLDNNLKQGSIITINKEGGIISHYQQIINLGIDKKFSMSNEELEKEKNDMVVSDNYDGKLLYPEDNVILLINENSPISIGVKVGEYFVSGPVVKYKENAIIRNDTNPDLSAFYNEIFDYEKEFYFSDKLSDLEEKLKKTIENKKVFSKGKARQIAYEALDEVDKKRVVDWKNSEVVYRVNGTQGAQIDIMLPTNTEFKYMMVSMNGDYKITSILK